MRILCLAVVALGGVVGVIAGAQAPAVVAHGELTLTIKNANRMVPRSLKLLLSLSADGQGVVSLPAHQIAGFSAPAIAAVTWKRAGEELVVARHAMSGRNSTFVLDTVRIRLDSNAPDRGRGTASGDMTIMLGDTVNGGPFEASMQLTADRISPTYQLNPMWSESDERILPREPLRVTFSEPVNAPAVASTVRLMTGTGVLPCRIEVINPQLGLAGNAVITPIAAAPPNAEVTANATGVADMFGNRASGESKPLRMIATPGNALANADFEYGLEEWIANGAVAAAGTERGVGPSRGVRQAVLKTPARLVSQISVPATASTLSLRTAAFSEGAGFHAGRSAIVWLLVDGERHTIFDAGAVAGRAVQTAPTTVTFDITRWRNRDVFIVAEVRGSGYFGMNYHTLLLDDFVLR